MKLAKARKLCKKWQTKLRMSELDILVRFPVPKDKFDPEEFSASCWWHPEFSSKGVMIVRPNVDEHDIVHELLHFRLEGHTYLNSKEAIRRRGDTLYERALNAIAEALTGVPE